MVGPFTEVIINILLCTFTLVVISWTLSGIASFINEIKKGKRDDEREKRDEEYHKARMAELKK